MTNHEKFNYLRDEVLLRLISAKNALRTPSAMRDGLDSQAIISALERAMLIVIKEQDRLKVTI